MRQSKKVGDASIRVLETLKLLCKNSLSIKEIINYFEQHDPNNKIYTNEVILKYINTLKVCGFVFVKEKDKYKLLNSPVRFDLDEDDIKAVHLIEHLAEGFPEEKIRRDVNLFLQDLEKRLSEQTKMNLMNIPKNNFIKINVNYDKYVKKIRLYEGYCIEEQKVKITYLTRDRKKVSAIFDPSGIKYQKDLVFFSVYNTFKAQVEDINLNNIISVEQLPLKSNMRKMSSTVTFKMKDRLAKAYNLHEGERLQDSFKDSIVVVNQFEDRDHLLRRLMKYGEFCEVISPKCFKEEMKKIIKETIKMYE